MKSGSPRSTETLDNHSSGDTFLYMTPTAAEVQEELNSVAEYSRLPEDQYTFTVAEGTTPGTVLVTAGVGCWVADPAGVLEGLGDLPDRCTAVQMIHVLEQAAPVTEKG